MNPSRRSMLSSIAVLLPFGIGTRMNAIPSPSEPPQQIRFRSFEDAVRQAFATAGPAGSPTSCRRVEIGHSDRVWAGIQGCHNDRPFAGFSAGQLKLTRIGSEPGPVSRGLRLYVCTVEVALAAVQPQDAPSRPLDFASLPAAPILG